MTFSGPEVRAHVGAVLSVIDLGKFELLCYSIVLRALRKQRKRAKNVAGSC